MVDTSGSTAHLSSLVVSSISSAQEKLVEIGIRTSFQTCSSFNHETRGEALYPHRILTLVHHHTLLAEWCLRLSRPTPVWAWSCHRYYRHYRHPSQSLQSAHSHRISRIYHKVGTCAVTPSMALSQKQNSAGSKPFLAFAESWPGLGQHSIDRPPPTTSHALFTHQ